MDRWIYLSPHPDDIALSCGGLVWEQVQAGTQVEIWTICAGDAPPGPLSSFAEELLTRWGVGRTAAAIRRLEDAASSSRLGASYRHFSIPDCIYRKSDAPNGHFYSAQTWSGPIHPLETGLIQQLCLDFNQHLPPQANLVCPLALGGHVDHRLVRAAAENLDRSLWYYADYPYVLRMPDYYLEFQKAGLQDILFPVSPAGLESWVQAVAAHKSQISTFWPDMSQMEAAITNYWQQSGGVRLWRLAPGSSP